MHYLLLIARAQQNRLCILLMKWLSVTASSR